METDELYSEIARLVESKGLSIDGDDVEEQLRSFCSIVCFDPETDTEPEDYSRFS